MTRSIRFAAALLLMESLGFATVVSAGAGTATPTGLMCLPACDAGQTCSQGLCVAITACSSDDECQSDTRCESGVGCVAWSASPSGFAQSCGLPAPKAVMHPEVKCAFTQAPPGDAFPLHLEVQNTPVVFSGLSPDAPGTRANLIAAVFTAPLEGNYTEDLGIVRILRANDCSLVANLGGTDLDSDAVVDWMVSSHNLAAADLDADGVAEIVAAGADGSTLAFTSDAGQWQTPLLWKAPYPAGAAWFPCVSASHRCTRGWGATSIHDLDDDAQPEVVREGVVFSASGALRSAAPAGYTSFSVGLAPVLVNLDADAAIEFSNGDAVWEWQAGGWVADGAFVSASPGAGFVGFGDFGSYGTGVIGARAELVVVRSGVYFLFAATGEVIDTQPLSGFAGGMPTIADFDGDGLLETGIGNRTDFTVFDLDCGATPRPGGVCVGGSCSFSGGACPTGIAWSRPVQEGTSGVTPTSAFDFEGDGASEILVSDECFTRAFDALGSVLFSRYNTSCTWQDTPVIADLDGDARADMIVPSNTGCGAAGVGLACTSLTASGVDPLFNGQACTLDSDCPGGSCSEGLCRCASAAECCADGSVAECEAAGFRCVAPEAGTPGSGDTCRSGRPGGRAGITVFSDPRWSNTRPIWNQQAYAVTHVRDDATVPRRSEWPRSWLGDSNGFRANPGWGQPRPDLTTAPDAGFTCSSGTATLSAVICNRGTSDVAAGASVAFLEGVQARCTATTPAALAPGGCANVSCAWAGVPDAGSNAVDLELRADADNAALECHEGNNRAALLDVFCLPDAIFADGFEAP